MIVRPHTCQGWCKPSRAARYAGVSVKTFRRWLGAGLRHVRLENGRILTKFSFVDEYLLRYEVEDPVAGLVDEILED